MYLQEWYGDTAIVGSLCGKKGGPKFVSIPAIHCGRVNYGKVFVQQSRPGSIMAKGNRFNVICGHNYRPPSI